MYTQNKQIMKLLFTYQVINQSKITERHDPKVIQPFVYSFYFYSLSIDLIKKDAQNKLTFIPRSVKIEWQSLHSIR